MAKAPINVAISGDYNDKDIKRAMKDLSSLQKEGAKNQTAFGKISQSVKGFGLSAVGATLGVVGIGAALVSFTKGAEDAEIANRKLGNVLEQMGFGEATARVAAYAETLERTVAVDADVIKSTQTKLATFKNLTESVNEAGGAFDRATLAALDLAAAGFGSAETNAVQLGKALQDPIKGITALARAGVTFTEQEKDKIKTLVESNDTLSAQNLILEAIEKQVGGTAEAGASSFERIRLSAMQVADVIGLALLPFVESFADFLSNTLVPAINGMTSGIGNATRVINDNKAAFILVTVAVGALTAALVVQRTALTASSIAFAVNVAASKLLVGAINLSTTAIVAMSAAMRLIPFVAVATAAAAFILVLDKGAKSHKEYITQTENNLRSTNRLRDANGKFTREAVALGLAMRGSRGALQDNRDAISGTAAAAIAAGNAMGSTLTPNTYDAGDAAEQAAASYLSLFESIWNAKRIASDFANTSGTVTSALSEGVKMGGSPVWTELANRYGAIDKAARGAASGASAAGSAISKSAENAKEAVAKYKESFKGVREYLTEAVDEIKTKMADMATSVSSSLMRGFQLGETAEEFGEDGARIGGTFIEKLQAQADRVTNFAAKIKELMSLGLNVNSPLMQAVIAEGAGSGTAIAQHLIDGGANTINQAQEMLLAAQGAADEIGTLAATNFYGAGLESAQQTLNAFVDRFGVNGKARQRLMTLMDNLANVMKRETTITVTTINRVVSQSVDGARAMGGPVAAGKAYLVGERGPEVVVMGQQSGYVVPNHDIVSSMSGGGAGMAGGTTINLTVNAGMGTQGAEVGRQIVDALKAYERRNGSVYVAA
jgi:hypothetical protein